MEKNKIKLSTSSFTPPTYDLYEDEQKAEINCDTPDGLWIGIMHLVLIISTSIHESVSVVIMKSFACETPGLSSMLMARRI